MKVTRIKPIDQKSDYMQDLAINNGTTVSSCGYITCALIQYFSEQLQINLKSELSVINQKNMTVYIQRVMKVIKGRRQIQLEKYKNKMNEKEQKNYLRDWVASFQIADYLKGITDKMLNSQVYFFRQSAYDHPQALKTVKYQQAQRIKEQSPFKGQKIFFSKFGYQKHELCHKDKFSEQLKMISPQQPVLIATDVLGHFNVMILFKGQVYIVDSLSDKVNNYDEYIVEFIIESYKKSYLK